MTIPEHWQADCNRLYGENQAPDSWRDQVSAQPTPPVVNPWPTLPPTPTVAVEQVLRDDDARARAEQRGPTWSA